MGKKSKFKQLRKLANVLPEIPVNVVYGEKELMEGGVDRYIATENKVIETKLNHNRKLKQMYNKGGLAAVVAYKNAVMNYVTKQNETENV